MRVAESILFAGKAIRVLRNPSPAFHCKNSASTQHLPRGGQKYFPFQKEALLCENPMTEELLPQSEADKIETMLQILKVHFINLFIIDKRLLYWVIVVPFLAIWFSSYTNFTILCRNHLNFTKDHLNLLLTLSVLLQLVICGRC